MKPYEALIWEESMKQTELLERIATSLDYLTQTPAQKLTNLADHYEGIAGYGSQER